MSELPAWQPIETAPKDGTQILAFNPADIYCPIVILRWESGAWVDTEYDFYEPTNWMPLPEPPGEEEK